MNLKKLEGIEQQIAQMRRSPQKARDLESLAQSLDRIKSKRGKEPTWVSVKFSSLSPLSIPHHGGRDLSIGTRNSILTQLEDDIAEWHRELETNGTEQH